MSNTKQRLDAYLAAEARILTAGLSKAIRELEARLAIEQGRGGSGGSLRYRTAVFNG